MASQSSTPIPPRGQPLGAGSKTAWRLIEPVTGAAYEIPVGFTLRAILYLAKHQVFFDDKDTTGNFSFSLKDGNSQIKNDIAIQAQ